MSCPTVCTAGHQYPVRSQHPEHLVSSDSLGRINDQQIDQSIDQGEFGAGESAGGDLAVDPFGEHQAAGRVNVGGVAVETVDLVPGVDSQGSGQIPFSTAQVDDQSASNLGLFDQPRGIIGGSSGNRGRERAGGEAADKKCRQKS